VSHELRTPLNSILLLSKMLSDSKSGLNPDQLKQAKVINEAGSDLQALIDNILDLSRIEARRTSFNIERLDVAELMQDLIELVMPQFEHKGLWLKLECDEDAPARITSDRDKVAQIIKNFLSNAVKFTTHGGITLRIRREIRSDACDCDLRISVTDSGIGIPAEKHDHIFEAFKQADGATNRRYGGTGLGLTISQQLAHLLGGHIELDSRENEGSTFSLLLPLQFDPERVDAEHVTHHDLEDEPGMATLKPQPQTPPQEEQLFTGHNILVVDNDVQNLLALTPLLEKWGLEVTAAGDGGEAMEALEEEHFSLVLIDVMMPGLNGYDTIRRIRAGHRTDHLSVIALTAETGSSEREACIEAGADDFVSKPLDPEELRETIARHLPDDPSSDLK
jgi:CheY-like chemotaxis protein